MNFAPVRVPRLEPASLYTFYRTVQQEESFVPHLLLAVAPLPSFAEDCYFGHLSVATSSDVHVARAPQSSEPTEFHAASTGHKASRPVPRKT